MIRVISFLGLGKQVEVDPDIPASAVYRPVKYAFPGKEPTPRTPLHDAATILAAGDELGSLIVLATAAVKARWFGEDKLYEGELQRLGIDATPTVVDIPDGRSTEELRLVHGTVLGLLTEQALTVSDSEGGVFEEEGRPTEIWLDVTHGFRVLPILAMSAVQAAADRHRTLDDTPSIRIHYGAFEANRDEVKPYWDLTWIADAQAWNRSVDALMSFGHGGELAGRLRLLQGVDYRLRGENRGLGGLAGAVLDFSGALATVRVRELLTRQAPRLAERVGEAEAAVKELVPSLARRLAELRGWAESMASPDVASIEGVRAMGRVGRVYSAMGRWAELLVMLREGTITLAGLEGGDLPDRLDGSDRAIRLGWGERLGAAFAEVQAQREPTDTALRRELVKLFGTLAEPRNDLAHGGFNPDPRSSASLIRQVNQLLLTFDEVLESSPLRE